MVSYTSSRALQSGRYNSLTSSHLSLVSRPTGALPLYRVAGKHTHYAETSPGISQTLLLLLPLLSCCLCCAAASAGCEDGCEDGCPVGCEDGCVDGCEVGSEDGCPEGCEDGCADGCPEG
jgi:hypothetical protein